MAPLVIGFDLDMTLIDSRVGVREAMVALVAETGAPIDADVVASRLGPPLEQELAEWVPADQIDPLADRYRELYAELGIAGTLALPGRRERRSTRFALACGRTLVVTAKFEQNAWLCLEQTKLDVDDVVGWRHGPQKGETLLEHGASVYVGDTPPDMEAARIAGAVGVAVPTGPSRASSCATRAPTSCSTSLLDFPTWLGSAPRITPTRPHGADPRRLSARDAAPSTAGPQLAGDEEQRPRRRAIAMPITSSSIRPIAVSLELVCIDTVVPGRTGNTLGDASGRSAVTRSRNASAVWCEQPQVQRGDVHPLRAQPRDQLPVVLIPVFMSLRSATPENDHSVENVDVDRVTFTSRNGPSAPFSSATTAPASSGAREALRQRQRRRPVLPPHPSRRLPPRRR